MSIKYKMIYILKSLMSIDYINFNVDQALTSLHEVYIFCI